MQFGSNSQIAWEFKREHAGYLRLILLDALKVVPKRQFEFKYVREIKVIHCKYPPVKKGKIIYVCGSGTSFSQDGLG